MLERRLGSGIILAEQSMDGAAIERALRRKDPQLRLQGWPSQLAGCVIWKVVREYPDRPPETICVWQSDRGEPYPLSSGLLDMVDQLDKNSRAVYRTEDQLNQELREQQEKNADAAKRALVADHATTAGVISVPMFKRTKKRG